jgi:hypothetical protein
MHSSKQGKNSSEQDIKIYILRSEKTIIRFVFTKTFVFIQNINIKKFIVKSIVSLAMSNKKKVILKQTCKQDATPTTLRRNKRTKVQTFIKDIKRF